VTPLSCPAPCNAPHATRASWRNSRGIAQRVAKHKDKIETINLFIPIIPYYFDGDDRNHWNHQQTDIKSCHIKKKHQKPYHPK
jgi:hypothetical protein